MSTEPDRDPVTDALLRKALQPTPQIGSDGCVDAETLAAWTEGNLPAEQAADVEAHLAGCSHCQAVLGAFATTDESVSPAASSASVIPFTPKSPIRWVLPFAASIAATLVLWMVVRDCTATPASELQQTLAYSKSDATPSAPAEVPANRGDATPRATPIPPPALAKKQVGAATKEEKTANAPKMSTASRPAATPMAGPAGSTAANRALTSPPPPPPAMAAPPPIQVAGGAAVGRQEALRSAAETVRADASAEAALKVVVEFTPRISTPMDRVAAGGAGGGRGGGGGGGRAAGGSAAARSVAPPAQAPMPARWRIMGSGQVMKSTNGGEAWAPIPLAPAIFIVSGDAPSASVCWLAGRAGVVMRSTDGTTFTQVMFPIASDLRSITAIDARQATVTAANGQVFTTIDGGDTWQLK